MLLPRLFTSVILLLFCLNASAQPFELSRKQLIGEWYSSNDDSLFFKSDTLVFIRRSDSNLVLDKMCVSPDLARERGLLNCMEFVNLRFRTRNRLEMWLYEGYSSEVWLNPMHWNLDDRVVSITSRNTDWTFLIIQMDTVRLFDQNHSFFERFATPRMRLLRVEADSIHPISERLEFDSDKPLSEQAGDSLKQLQRENILRTLKHEE